MRSLLHRLRREDGIALPTVMGALVVTAMLATTTFAVSIDRQQTSAADRDGKRAAAAAQAALDLGFLRLTTVKPAAAQCVTDVAVAPVGGECPIWTEPATSPSALGNDATMRYVVSVEGAPGCRSLPAAADNRAPALKAKDRCITASGSVNAVTRRLQTRVIYSPAVRPWLSVGMVGKDSVDLDNNRIINSPVGSNGTVKAGNNTRVYDNIVLPVGPPAARYIGPAHTTGGFLYPPERFEFPDVDFAPARAASINQDDNPGYLAWYNSVLAQGAQYNATTRVLNIDDESGILELPGGVYSFCQITMRQNSRLRVKPNTGVLQIWIDAPRDGPANCPSGTGKVYLNNGADMNVPAVGAPDPTLLELYVKGTDYPNGDARDVELTNDNMFHGTIWAPFSTIYVYNNGAISGGMTGANIDMKNNGTFSYPDSIRNKTLPGTGNVRREGWFECSATPPVPADNESGCTT